MNKILTDAVEGKFGAFVIDGKYYIRLIKHDRVDGCYIYVGNRKYALKEFVRSEGVEYETDSRKQI